MIVKYKLLNMRYSKSYFIVKSTMAHEHRAGPRSQRQRHFNGAMIGCRRAADQEIGPTQDGCRRTSRAEPSRPLCSPTGLLLSVRTWSRPIAGPGLPIPTAEGASWWRTAVAHGEVPFGASREQKSKWSSLHQSKREPFYSLRRLRTKAESRSVDCGGVTQGVGIPG
jgi:hypothetical protein